MLSMPLPRFSPEHIHPILVNFTAALVPMSVGSDLFGRMLRRPSLSHAAWWALIYAAAFTPFTALAGLWWKPRVIEMAPPQMMAEHQRLGISLAIALVVMTGWRYAVFKRNAAPGWAYLGFAMVVVIALILQGALGGALVFGS